MVTLVVVATNGEEITIKVQQLVSINGKPVSSPQSDSSFEDRLSALEQAFIALIGERHSCQNPEFSSVESMSPVIQTEHPS
jgi:hypothetical protein